MGQFFFYGESLYPHMRAKFGRGPSRKIDNPLYPPCGGSIFFLNERVYPHMRAKFGCGPTVVSKKPHTSHTNTSSPPPPTHIKQTHIDNPLNPPGLGWAQFFLGECRSRLYPHMRAKFGRDPTAGSKKLPFKFISRCHITLIGSS